MANNATAGFGCRQTMTVGNTPATGGQSEFTVQGGGSPGATKAIFKGAPVAMQTAAGGAGVLGHIQDQGGTGKLLEGSGRTLGALRRSGVSWGSRLINFAPFSVRLRFPQKVST